jgi:hypothetical protein
MSAAAGGSARSAFEISEAGSDGSNRYMNLVNNYE